MGRPTLRRNGKPLTSTERVRRHRKKLKAAAKVDRGHDAYPTTPGLLERLFDAEPDLLPKNPWEPCCGTGNLVRPMVGRGCKVTSSDIVLYEGSPEDAYVLNFLEATELPPGCGGIVTNPPFSYGRGAIFVRKALSLAPTLPILMLLPTAYVAAKGRADIHSRLVRIWQFRLRPKRMHRLDHNGRLASAQLDVAWFLFRSDHTGPAEVRWL